MPVQTAKSSLAAKYPKLGQHVKAHAKDATEYGTERLPPGITSGIAQLVECGFLQFEKDNNSGAKKGDWFFRAAGVVIEPESVIHEGREIAVKGRQTSVIESLCDTKTSTGKPITQEEHVANIMNTMRQLAGEDFTANAGGAEDLEAFAAALKGARPYFKFSTSEGKAMAGKPARVWENWHGSKDLEGYEPGATNGQLIDETGNQDAPAGDQPADPDAPQEASELAELIVKCGEGDEAAMKAVVEMARAAGVEEDVITSTDTTWEALGELITAAGSGEPAIEQTEPEPEPWKPAKGDAYNYQQVDSKGKPVIDPRTKKAKKPFQVEVTAVDARRQMVNVVDSATKKVVIKDVKWDKLIHLS